MNRMYTRAALELARVAMLRVTVRASVTVCRLECRSSGSNYKFLVSEVAGEDKNMFNVLYFCSLHTCCASSQM